MKELEQILRHHAKKYPLMQPTDAVKLIYQNEFGGGHLIRDPEACSLALGREYENTPQNPELQMLESIGNGMVRVMLAGIGAGSYGIEQLKLDFIRSSEEHRGNRDSFLEKLEVLRRITADGIFAFTAEELASYLEDYKNAGYPMVSHSAQYRESYKPAYRIVMRCLLPEEFQ